MRLLQQRAADPVILVKSVCQTDITHNKELYITAWHYHTCTLNQ